MTGWGDGENIQKSGPLIISFANYSNNKIDLICLLV